MISDQLAKLKAQRPNPDSGLFLLSWTLTQQLVDILDAESIIDFAQQVFPMLFNPNSLWDASGCLCCRHQSTFHKRLLRRE
jgi:hypothetical protein